MRRLTNSRAVEVEPKVNPRPEVNLFLFRVALDPNKYIE
jgi:hypothetical protein